MKRYFLFLLITLSPFLLPAQNDESDDAKSDFDSYRASLIENFYGSKEKMVTEFDDFRSKAIAEYVEFVRQAWREFKSEPPVPVPEEVPVPPVVIPDEDRNVPIEDRPLIIDEVLPPFPVVPQPQPVVKIDEIPTLHEEYVYFTFFGTDVKIRFSMSHKVIVDGTDENVMADAIEAMASKMNDNTLLDCLLLRKALNLSDWAYLQMIDAFAHKVYGQDDNSAALLTTYLYMLSGYKVRIGATDGNIYMLFACEEQIYNKNMFIVGGTSFYGIDELPVRMHICEATFEKEQELSLVVKGGQRFAYKGSAPRRITAKDYPDVSVEVSVNENLLKFYDTYPTSKIGDNVMTRWAMYANVELDERVKNSVYPTLSAAINGLSEIEAVNRLLNFVQTGLVLEGGGTRGIYTAGVLDVFLENDITFDGVIGVSAGAIHGCSYISKQKGRSLF